jgi:hypothetical protein
LKETRIFSRARALFMLVAVGSAVFISGCGGGGGTTASATKAAFVPNFANETDPQTHLLNKLYHWPTFPVRVYISPTQATGDMKIDTLAGVKWWEQATNIVGQFVIVDDPASADITVDFRDDGANGFSGLTQYSYDSGGTLVKAAISINLAYLTTPAEFTSAAAHEMGHALGIGGHSNNPKDLMSFSPTIFLLTAPSVRDVNTMKTSYADLFSRAATPAVLGGPIETTTIRCPAAVK